MKQPPAFPGPDARDNDDVSWALCTAAALWKLGRFGEAVVWVQRAANSAAEGDAHADSNVRVAQLTAAATELSAYVREWERGQDSDPKSVAISVDFDTEAISVQLEELEESAPATVQVHVPNVPKVKPAARPRAETLGQDPRTPLPKVDVEPKAAQSPRAGVPSLSRTLPEATISPFAIKPASAGPLGDKPKTPIGPAHADSIADPVRIEVTPTPAAVSEPAVTKRMEDVPTRRIQEGEAWPAADIGHKSDTKTKPARKG